MFARFDLSALSRRRSAKFALAFCAAVVSVALVTFTALAWRDKKGSTAKQDPPAVQPTAARKATPLGRGYIDRRGIWPQLHSALDAYGNRLEKPGKERLFAIGTLSNANSANNEKVPVRLLSEFPDKLRIEKQRGNKFDTAIFDGRTKVKIGDTIDPQEEEELESLVFDSVDHFMAAHMLGKPLRFLGDRFRLDDGTASNYTGPYYDIYQMTEQQFDANNNVKETALEKLYFF